MTSDMNITNSKENIICSICYTESSGVGSYSCPESDYFLCGNCYQSVLNYLQYIYYIYYLDMPCSSESGSQSYKIYLVYPQNS